MRRRPLPYHRLHPDLVEAVRTAFDVTPDARHLLGYRYLLDHEVCHVCVRPSSRDYTRLMRLAAAMGYDGLIVGEVVP